MQATLTAVDPKIDLLESRIYAKDQPQYLPLPTSVTPSGEVVSCWRPNLWARLRILFGGKFYLTLLTFNEPLQPIRVSVEKPRYELRA